MPKQRQPTTPDPYALSTSLTVLTESLRQNMENFASTLIDQVSGHMHKLEERIEIQDKVIEALVRKEQEREAREERERSVGTPEPSG